MFRSIVRAAALGAVALSTVAVTQAASATTFSFNLTKQGNKSASGYQGLSFKSTSGTQSLGFTAYGGHLSDSTNWLGMNTVSAAKVETWQGYGMGVLYGNDSTRNGTHQIDNVGGGIDFVALQFDQAVTLSSINRVSYGISGYGSDSDASFLAYSGSLASLAFTGVKASSFSNLMSGDYSTNSSVASTIWLVAANVGRSDRDDGFKLTGLTVNTIDPVVPPVTPVDPGTPPGAVPEPASWAMMIVGFGAVGTGMRRRKVAKPAAA